MYFPIHAVTISRDLVNIKNGSISIQIVSLHASTVVDNKKAEKPYTSLKIHISWEKQKPLHSIWWSTYWNDAVGSLVTRSTVPLLPFDTFAQRKRRVPSRRTTDTKVVSIANASLQKSRHGAFPNGWHGNVHVLALKKWIKWKMLNLQQCFRFLLLFWSSSWNSEKFPRFFFRNVFCLTENQQQTCGVHHASYRKSQSFYKRELNKWCTRVPSIPSSMVIWLRKKYVWLNCEIDDSNECFFAVNQTKIQKVIFFRKIKEWKKENHLTCCPLSPIEKQQKLEKRKKEIEKRNDQEIVSNDVKWKWF